MDDEDFKKAVLARFDHVDARMDAIFARLKEQDNRHDLLVDKVDRLSHAVRDGLAASEQALSAVSALSRRVYRLEHPGEGRG